MRKIKFRAWDTTSKAMYDLNTVEDYPFSYIAKGDTPYTKFMQYTGLKDKNGIEIYEGDIIVGDSYGNYPLIIKWDETVTGFYCHDPKGNEDDHLNAIEATNGKVIGNIYENAEILNLT